MAGSNSPIDWALDPGDPVPLHERVAAEIRRAIAEGQVRQGKRLPPAMDLAAVLGVSRNTVLRALRLLRDEGLVDFRRGRGITARGMQPEANIGIANWGSSTRNTGHGGPGKSKSSGDAAMINMARADGTRILGYIATNRGTRRPGYRLRAFSICYGSTAQASGRAVGAIGTGRAESPAR